VNGSNSEQRLSSACIITGSERHHHLRALAGMRTALYAIRSSGRSRLRPCRHIFFLERPHAQSRGSPRSLQAAVHIDWINAADPHPSHEISAESAGDDATAYLVEVEDREELDEWLELNAETLFESELEGWYTIRLCGRRIDRSRRSRRGVR
jgi:hypothetical protein